MNQPLRSLLYGTAWLLGSMAIAQPAPPYTVTISGQVTPCGPANSYVNITTVQGTQPSFDMDVPLDSTCSYSVTVDMDSWQGWFQVGTPCSGAMQYNTGSYTINALDTTASVMIDISCGGGSGNCQADFSVQQAMNDSTPIPWQITTTNLSTGPVPIIYQWWLPDGSSSTDPEPSFTFSQPGEYGICLTIASGLCTSTFCDTVVVDTSGLISTIPVWYDCQNVLWGTATPGSPCDDGDPLTSNDTWSANCICAGVVCEAPAITGMPGTLSLCSNDSLVLSVAATGTAPFYYHWTGPGIIFTDSLYAFAYATATAGTYAVTVTNGCGSANAQVAVTVTAAPNAGLDTTISSCDITSITDMIVLQGGTPSAGGTWTFGGLPHNSIYDPNVDGPGTYQYTLAGVAPCADAISYLYIAPTTVWYGDADGDGLGDPNFTIQSCTQPAGYVSNAYDACPLIFGTVGSVCDDGDPSTTNDHINANCECVGTDPTTVDCLGIPGGPNVVGSVCTDSIGGLIVIGNWDANCICQPGTFLDCLGIPGGSDLPGTACTDPMGDAGTWNADCICVPDTSGSGCNADFWVIQAYDSTASGGVEPIPNEVWVWNLSSGGNGNYQFLWNFGDGTSSTDAFPTHVYGSDGPWNLCLTIASGLCTDTYCDSVSVDANGLLNQLVIDGGNGNVTHEAPTGTRSGGFTLNVIQHLPTGITEMPAFTELMVWPNPVNDALNISFNNSVTGTVPVTVIDPSGRTVISENHSFSKGGNTLRIPTDKLDQGLYMMRIGTGAKSVTKRFLKVQ